MYIKVTDSLQQGKSVSDAVVLVLSIRCHRSRFLVSKVAMSSLLVELVGWAALRPKNSWVRTSKKYRSYKC
jgi:hypothetical protein